MLPTLPTAGDYGAAVRTAPGEPDPPGIVPLASDTSLASDTLLYSGGIES